MPDMEPSSDQLQLVVQLVSGMGHNTLLDAPGSPMAKLREALSSKNAFQKLYMEVSELAISTYKHIGRLRSARVIGRDLARYVRAFWWYSTLSEAPNATPHSKTMDHLRSFT